MSLHAPSDLCSFCHVCNCYSLCCDRDILEVFSGKFPHLHTQSECRCPGSHPRVHPLIQRYCIPNGADDTTNDRVLRLDAEAHPLYYINDNDIGTTWISSVFANTAGLDRGVSITIDLQNGQYQVMGRCHLSFIENKKIFCRYCIVVLRIFKPYALKCYF